MCFEPTSRIWRQGTCGFKKSVSPDGRKQHFEELIQPVIPAGLRHPLPDQTLLILQIIARPITLAKHLDAPANFGTPIATFQILAIPLVISGCIDQGFAECPDQNHRTHRRMLKNEEIVGREDQGIRCDEAGTGDEPEGSGGTV